MASPHMRKTPCRGAGMGDAEHHREREAEHVARVGRIDDAVVPEPRGGVERARLLVVLARIGAVSAASSSGDIGVSPRARSCSRLTERSVAAACSPPITEMRAFGQVKRRRGP